MRRQIYCCGSSQGGGLTLITTGLKHEIKAGVAGYPFLCCFPESMRMLRSYPYDELSCYGRAYPDRVEQALDTLRYFDAVNFAPRIECPMAVGIAMEDEVCPAGNRLCGVPSVEPRTRVAAVPQFRPRKRPRLSRMGGRVAATAHGSHSVVRRTG